MLRKRGFTLIELLVVIAIIGILATLVVTQLSQLRVRARNTQVKNYLTELDKAAGLFAQENNSADKVVAATDLVSTTAGVSPAGIGITAGALNAAGGHCVAPNGAASTPAAVCASNKYTGTTAAADTKFQAIFKGSLTAGGVGTANSYGTRVATALPGGYALYYMTASLAVPTLAGDLVGGAGATLAGGATGAEYAIVGDLGTTGGPADSTARFYVVTNGNSKPVTWTGATGPNNVAPNASGPTAITAYAPSFIASDNF